MVGVPVGQAAAMGPVADAKAVLRFWFDPASRAHWFVRSEAFDREVGARFARLHQAVTGGQCESWLEQPEPALAYVIVCDQFSRHLFRGSRQAFAADARALRAASQMVGRRWDEQFSPDERVFVYLPYEHSEQLDVQHIALVLFGRLARSASGDPKEAAQLASYAEWARKHFAVIARFGRFPHRNEVLGRACTAQESAFLSQPGSRF